MPLRPCSFPPCPSAPREKVSVPPPSGVIACTPFRATFSSNWTSRSGSPITRGISAGPSVATTVSTPSRPPPPPSRPPPRRPSRATHHPRHDRDDIIEKDLQSLLQRIRGVLHEKARECVGEVHQGGEHGKGDPAPHAARDRG